MQNLNFKAQRRTTTDQVFDSLHDEIQTLKLLPGDKMSEVEVAARFDVSRQPVRNAFNRLGNLDLLLIRPQRATVVRGFSLEKIDETRFLRLAVELEVVRRACDQWTASASKRARANLAQQHQAIVRNDWDTFHFLDFEFHTLLCEISDCHLAIDTIKNSRQKTDRLCALSFDREKEVETVFEDHRQLIISLESRNRKACFEIIREHLARLDVVIAEIRSQHADYFE